MLQPRVIPCLLLKNRGLVKTVGFREPTYVGDALNAIKIFNEKQADELIFLDIEAATAGRPPAFDIIEMIAGECFMPVCYGGGVRNLGDMEKIFKLGIEKISLSSVAAEQPELVTEAARMFGSQSVIVCLDVKRNVFGKPRVVTRNASVKTGRAPLEFARKMERLGAGELVINSVDRDGTMQGFDLELIEQLSAGVDVPVIACGGAGSIGHVKEALRAGASAAAAGSMFVFHGKHRAVLISYPEPRELAELYKAVDAGRQGE